ncbi:MAG: hypothetical protein KF894_12550, partial [Labilithrix sp.]|nr:hypothetical protein [Labilithrix sp.]
MSHGGTTWAKISKQDATGSAVGYYYQGLFAILLLFEQQDDGLVSVETGDDIQQGGPASPRLTQLKHSLGTPPPLNEKSDGFWKTLGFWIPHLSTSQATFAFVTCAKISDETALRGLTDGGSATLSDVMAALDAEAARVAATVAAAKANSEPGKPLPYAQRLAGCVAYLALAPTQRLNLLSRMRIYAAAPNAATIESAVVERLTTYQRPIRTALARRLVEWWDYRVARSLIGAAPREIYKEELLDKLNEIAGSLSTNSLPDDFSSVEPLSVNTELGTTMEKQIALVSGGKNRVLRAALARWQARSQRERWLSERVGVADDLKRFDDMLIKAWRDRHGPMCDDSVEESDEQKRHRGRELLDWSHLAAYLQVVPIREKWNQPFLVQGSFQELAERADVGWHPDFLVL